MEMNKVKKLLSGLLAVLLLMNLVMMPGFALEESTFSLAFKASSDFNGGQPVENVKAGDTFYVYLTFSGNTTANNVCALDLYIGYDTEALQVTRMMGVGPCANTSCNPNKNGHAFMNWANQNGLVQQVDFDSVVLKEGNLAVLQCVAKSDLSSSVASKFYIVNDGTSESFVTNADKAKMTFSTDELVLPVLVPNSVLIYSENGDEVQVPTVEQDPATVTYQVIVTDAEGEVQTNPSIQWVIEGASAAVTVEDGVVFVPSSAAAGEYTLKATATQEANTGLTADVTAETNIRVTKKDAEAVSISIQKSGQPVATDSIAIPQTGTNTASYSAVVKDQYGATMENQTINWTLTPDGQASSQGVSVDTTGTVTVIPNATKGTYTLTAACSGKSATVNLTVVGITFYDVSYSTTGNPVYGNKWNQIVTNITGTAKIGDQVIEGTFTVNDAEGIPDAGTQHFYIVFNSREGSYRNVKASMGDPSVTISPKPVTVSGITAADKEYNGETTAELNYSNATITDKVGEDDLTVSSATGTFENENVGTDKTVTITNITLGGVDAANYTLAGTGNQTDAKASITTREVTVSGITAANKEYNGTTAAVLDFSHVTFTGMVAGDDLTVSSATGTFENKNVGTGKTVTITGITLDGADKGNYTLGSAPVTATADITAKTLEHVNVSGVTVTKVYDGTTSAGTVSGAVAFDGKVGEEIVSITATAGAYADKNVGTGKTVTLNLALDGADKGNYKLAQATAECSSASITARSTFTDATAQTQNAVVGVGTFAQPTFTGIDGETVTGETTYTYQGDTKIYNEIVTALQSLSKGTKATIGYHFTASGNYEGTKDGTIEVTMVDIVFTVDGATATSGNAVTVKTNPTYGDTWSKIVTINEEAISATLNGAPVKGTYSLVTHATAPDAGSQQYTVQFNDGEKNYTVCTGTVQIAQKPLTITGLGANGKEYDGGNTATVTGTPSLNGLVPGDNVSITTGTATFASKNVGLRTVTFSDYGITGSDADNYLLTAQPASVLATISPKSVTITGTTASDKEYDGDTDTEVETLGTLNGVIGQDNVTIKAGTATFASADVGTRITVTFSGFSLTGDGAGNYELSQQPDSTTANITKANYTGGSVSYNVNVLTKQETPARGTISVDAFFENVPAEAKITAVRVRAISYDIMDSVSASGGTITYQSNTKLTTAKLVDTYDVTISTKNYNDITATLTFTTVDKTPVIVSGVAVAGKTYDGKTVSYTGTPVAKVDGSTVAVTDFTYTWMKDDEVLAHAPKGAGSYQLRVAVAETDPAYTGYKDLSFTISKATITITAQNASVTVNSSMPKLSYQVSGLAEGEKLAKEPTLTCNAKLNQIGSYAIVPSGAAVPNTRNYNETIVYKNGTLSVVSNEKPQVTVTGGTHGFATISDPDAKEGDVVAITVTCDPGYEVDEVTVTTLSGKSVRVVKTGGKYTFVMPAEKVKIQVTYQEIQEVAYSDVVVGSWYEEAVAYVSDNGIMNGVGGGKFAPNRAVTRAMVWTVLARMDGEDTASTSLWYAKAQQWAMETGVSDGTNPESAITREQLATMLYRYYGSPAVSGSLSGYVDGASVTDWAKDAMVWAVQEGLIQGTGANKLSPTADTTRAQLAQILMRLDLKF